MLTLATMTLDVTLNQELPFAERTRAVLSKGTARSADLRPTQYSAIMHKWFSLVTLFGLI